MAALKDCIGKNNIASFFMTDKEQKQPNIYPIEKWVNKVCSIHKMKYYCALQWDRILILTHTQHGWALIILHWRKETWEKK